MCIRIGLNCLVKGLENQWVVVALTEHIGHNVPIAEAQNGGHFLQPCGFAFRKPICGKPSVPHEAAHKPTQWDTPFPRASPGLRHRCGVVLLPKGISPLYLVQFLAGHAPFPPDTACAELLNLNLRLLQFGSGGLILLPLPAPVFPNRRVHVRTCW